MSESVIRKVDALLADAEPDTLRQVRDSINSKLAEHEQFEQPEATTPTEEGPDIADQEGRVDDGAASTTKE